MKNITKLGLTALAGSLVASSAFAGEMSVSGSAKITHASADEKETQGNSFSNSKGISFSGSGELDNGYTVSTTYAMTNAAFSYSVVTIDMGDMGTVGLYNNSGGAGLTKYYDTMPTAGEQVWDDSDADDNGLPLHDNDNMLGYNGTFGGLGVSFIKAGLLPEAKIGFLGKFWLTSEANNDTLSFSNLATRLSSWLGSRIWFAKPSPSIASPA